MFVSRKNSQRGFSLVELMVVVAIIGILSAVGIPAMNKYMAKARQAEAKTNLSSVYTAEKSFFSEYTTYDSRFNVIGFSPEGKIRYHIGFTGPGKQADGTNNYTPPAAPGPFFGSFNSNGYCANPNAAGTLQNGCLMVMGPDGLNPPAVAAAACPATGATEDVGAPAGCLTAVRTFQAGAAAVVLNAASGTDNWAIDQLKNLRNTRLGIQ